MNSFAHTTSGSKGARTVTVECNRLLAFARSLKVAAPGAAVASSSGIRERTDTVATVAGWSA